MVYRSTLMVLTMATVLTLTVGGAEAQDKKYPNWKGEWATITARLPGQQLRFDPNKSYGKAQEAPLTEEYQKIYQDNLAEQALGGQGLFLDHASCLPAGMPTMMSAGTHEFIITPETTYIAGSDLRRILPMADPGQRISSRPIRASRSAAGSTRTAMASMTCSRSRPAGRSRGRGPTMRPACRCTSTTTRPSRNGSLSTRTIPTFCTMRSPCSIAP